jgi:hypothetical protein
MLLDFYPVEGGNRGQPLIATILDPTHLHLLAYTDGIVIVPAYKSTTQPAICDICKYILKTTGYISGSFPARTYALDILSGSTIVFLVPSVYYGSRQTQLPDLSDIEITRGITFTGQFI